MEHLETSLLLRWEKNLTSYIKNNSWESKGYCLYLYRFLFLPDSSNEETQDQQFAYLETSFIIKNIGLVQ